MSSGNFESSVELVLRPSRGALMMALWVHALPAALLPFTGLAPPWMMGLAGLIALSWIALRHHPALGFGKRAITRVRWDAEGQWFIWRGGSVSRPSCWTKAWSTRRWWSCGSASKSTSA